MDIKQQIQKKLHERNSSFDSVVLANATKEISNSLSTIETRTRDLLALFNAEEFYIQNFDRQKLKGWNKLLTDINKSFKEINRIL